MKQMQVVVPRTDVTLPKIYYIEFNNESPLSEFANVVIDFADDQEIALWAHSEKFYSEENTNMWVCDVTINGFRYIGRCYERDTEIGQLTACLKVARLFLQDLQQGVFK